MDQHTSSSAHTRAHAPGAPRSQLPSHGAYELEVEVVDGVCGPQLLGQGRFAKVLAARQTIAGRPSREVAIKILHDTIDRPSELLFNQEIALNLEFSTGALRGVAPVLDVIPLGPLVMCGCGSLYHPRCPKGCGLPLQRIDLRTPPVPALKCTKCGYELSAEYVNARGGELYGRTAKTCCTTQAAPNADTGTIINFVLREVMVMERLGTSLADYCMFVEDSEEIRTTERGLPERIAAYFGLIQEDVRLKIVNQRVQLLEKIKLMLKIGDTVAWLHAIKKVVHKDLAPDNIMINGPERLAPRQQSVRSLLDRASDPGTEIRVIDFGLSDKNEPSRSWYEDADMSNSPTKGPYLSPEAESRRQPIGSVLKFETDTNGERYFRIPPSLERSLRVSDIIADKNDVQHNRDLVITRIDGSSAYFSGAPGRANSAHFEVVRPLAEAHDVYALGAVFFYILTGRHKEVRGLKTLVESIQDDPCPLDKRSLAKRNNYPNRRNAIREPFWRDALMILILRAMVRGRPESFVHDRTSRGPEAAQRFLAELRRIQRGLTREVFEELVHPRRIWVRRAVAGAILFLFVFRSVNCWYPAGPDVTVAAQRESSAQATPLTAASPASPG